MALDYMKTITRFDCVCPICHKGMLEAKFPENSFIPEISCDVCNKKFIIEYEKNPFKITKVTEQNEY